MAKRSAGARQAGGLKIPCVRVGDRIAAGAVLSLPGQELPESQRDWFTDFLKTAGPSAIDFFPRFVQTLDTVEFPKPSAYLVMIGVDPEFQGQGVGKKLIDFCFDLANENPENLGMGLDTQDIKNTHIYRKCGFEVVEEKEVDGMPIYFMWRPR